MTTQGIYIELKKVNISIIKYPLFSVSLRTLLDKIGHQFILFCVIFPFLSNTLFCINGFYLSDIIHKQHIFFYLPASALLLAESALLLADWEMAPLYQSALN